MCSVVSTKNLKIMMSLYYKGWIIVTVTTYYITKYFQSIGLVILIYFVIILNVQIRISFKTHLLINQWLVFKHYK